MHLHEEPQLKTGLSGPTQVDRHELEPQVTVAPLHTWLAVEQAMSHAPLAQDSVALRHAWLPLHAIEQAWLPEHVTVAPSQP